MAQTLLTYIHTRSADGERETSVKLTVTYHGAENENQTKHSNKLIENT